MLEVMVWYLDSGERNRRLLQSILCISTSSLNEQPTLTQHCCHTHFALALPCKTKRKAARAWSFVQLGTHSELKGAQIKREDSPSFQGQTAVAELSRLASACSTLQLLILLGHAVGEVRNIACLSHQSRPKGELD